MSCCLLSARNFLLAFTLLLPVHILLMIVRVYGRENVGTATGRHESNRKLETASGVNAYESIVLHFVPENRY